MGPVIHRPTATTVGLATTERMLTLQKEPPQLRLVPCEPIEGEEIHRNAYLPMRPEERLAGPGRITEIEPVVQDKGGVYTVVVAILESNSERSDKTLA